MKATNFLIKFFNCKSREELYAIIFPGNYEEHQYQLNPLTLLPCLRHNNQQVYFDRFLEPYSNDNIQAIITECFPRAEDGTVQWDKPVYIMLDDLEVGECECSQKATHQLVYGEDNKENHL